MHACSASWWGLGRRVPATGGLHRAFHFFTPNALAASYLAFRTGSRTDHSCRGSAHTVDLRDVATALNAQADVQVLQALTPNDEHRLEGLVC